MQLAGARVREGDLVAAARAYREAEQRAPADERAGIQSRLGWLNKEMGNQRTRVALLRPCPDRRVHAVRDVRDHRDHQHRQPVHPVRPQPGQRQRRQPAAARQAGRPGGRVLAPADGDADATRSLIHLGLNMYALWIIGPLAEALYGRATYVAIYLLAGLGGSIASYLFNATPAVGASGAIFGLFGLVFVSVFVHKPALARQARCADQPDRHPDRHQPGHRLRAGQRHRLHGPHRRPDHRRLAGLRDPAARRSDARLASGTDQRPTDDQQPSRNPAILAAGGVLLLGIVMVVALQVTPFWAHAA